MNLLLFAIELPNPIPRNTHNYRLYVDPIVFRKPEALVLIVEAKSLINFKDNKL